MYNLHGNYQLAMWNRCWCHTHRGRQMRWDSFVHVIQNCRAEDDRVQWDEALLQHHLRGKKWGETQNNNENVPCESETRQA